MTLLFHENVIMSTRGIFSTKFIKLHKTTYHDQTPYYTITTSILFAPLETLSIQGYYETGMNQFSDVHVSQSLS